jgi:hypothetical protein
MFKKFLPLVLASAFFSVTITSCGPDISREQADVNAVDTSDYDDDEDNVTYILPSPLQIASIFRRSGMEFVTGITNPTANTANYTGTFNRSVAMGIYSADLAYTIVNNQNQEALNYLKSVKEISNDLGLGSVFDSESFIKRFERNLGNEDSLAFVVSDLQIDMDAYLEENDKEYIAVLIFAGAWVESVYLGSKTIEKTNNQKLSSRLGEQFIILNNLTKALRAHRKSNEQISGLLQELQAIQAEFDAVVSDPDEAADLQKEHLDALTASIGLFRAKLIAGSL